MQVQHLTLPYAAVGLPSSINFDNVDNNIEDRDVKVIALMKGKEQYVFIYNESNRSEALRLLARYASNPELSFTWYDAAVLSQKIRQDGLQRARERQCSDLSPCNAVPADEWL